MSTKIWNMRLTLWYATSSHVRCELDLIDSIYLPASASTSFIAFLLISIHHLLSYCLPYNVLSNPEDPQYSFSCIEQHVLVLSRWLQIIIKQRIYRKLRLIVELRFIWKPARNFLCDKCTCNLSAKGMLESICAECYLHKIVNSRQA